MFGLEQGCAHTPTPGFCIGRLGLRYPAGRATENRKNVQFNFSFTGVFRLSFHVKTVCFLDWFDLQGVACSNDNR